MQLCVVSVELEQYIVPIDNISDIFSVRSKSQVARTPMLTGKEHVVWSACIKVWVRSLKYDFNAMA